MSSYVIEVANNSKGCVTVVVSTNPVLQLLSDSLTVTFPAYELLKSFFPKDKRSISPGETSVVNKVSIWKMFTYGVGLTGAEWYCITVTREDDEWVAVCQTPLHCTWIVEDEKIYRQDKPSICKPFSFVPDDKSSYIIKVTNKTKEVISVVLHKDLLAQVLSNGLRRISSHVRDRYFKSGVTVCPGKTKTIHKVNPRNLSFYKSIMNVAGMVNMSIYSIMVIRERDKQIAQCNTPLHCTWIVESHGMWQENKPTEVCKFQ
ncbi:uncharacterized protein LOC115638468 [Gopherus evgoodei]|uniref:uncharacterized protein LOC115638468 n=1 Tax=Gopherus evgoodei TaxID=1825980 RepID=UPI0011D03129|nr:uncharacterized protein LOC115638468 [Gopherus evgoodei]XP_030395901.1 uncharacterized protein LOC115638468 [Gopherus evgoodei]